jgi:stage III sporulation protein SpoIIIAA
LRNLDNFDAEFFQKKFKELALDLGRRPRYLVEGKWSNLVEDPKEVVTSTDIAEMTLKLSGRFGDDNRAGFDGELHRISCMRNKKGQEYGFTLRVGRCIVGCANSIEDLLLSSTFKDKSILLLGIPGSGKTTIIREICRMLSMSGDNVIIVDTSNEIAGDGNVPHESIGCSRRMMVPNLSRQQAVMIECLQNHTPDVMVIDEIGRKEEALAAKTSKERGIRMFASAHGDFISLMSNPCLNYLVGGIEVVTIGDEAAKRNANKKTKAQRSHSAVFDVVIELSNREFNKWRIIKDVNAAVDKILNREPFTSEIRVFDPDTGRIDISHENEDRKLDLPQFDSELE